MYRVDLYARVGRACRVEGMSTREASRVFGLDRKTVRKMLSFSVPPGYRRGKPPRRPKLGPFTGIIDRILEDDRTSHHKQRHTAKRIFDRLRDEYGFTGGYTIVKDYVRERRLRSREMFVPLVHSPGHAQADFGEAMAVIGGVARKVHFLAFDLPHSDACFVKAYPAETTEAFCDGHNAAVAFFGGVPRSILYDNTKLAVARILGDGKRQRTRVFTELQSHYLFEDRFGRPGKGNDKGKVEGLVGFIRRNFLVPVPRAESFEALNDALAGQCRRRQAARLRGHKETIGERLARDLSLMAQGFLEFLPAAFRQAGIGSIARAVPARAARRRFLPGVEFQKRSVFDDPGHKAGCRRISFVEPFDGIYDIGNHEITLVGPKHRLSPLAGCRVTISHRYVRCGRIAGAATGLRPRALLYVAHVATLFEIVVASLEGEEPSTHAG